jgi:hypothetical protein
MPAATLAGVILLAAAGSFPALQRQAPTEPAPNPPAVAVRAEVSVEDRIVALEAELFADRGAQSAWLNRAALALASEPTADLEEAQRRIAAVLRLRGARLAATQPDWPDAQIDSFLVMLLIDARRFAYDADFRDHVLPVLRDGLAPEVPIAARERLVNRLNAIPGFDFGMSEKIEVAWGVVPRASRPREVAFRWFGDGFGLSTTIRASIYSLPTYFDYEDAAAFLRGVHAFAPQRDLVVLSNPPLIDRLQEALASEIPLHLIDTHGRRYTPWPRDPFAVVSSPDGPVTFVVRPNMQAQRENDVFMAREIVQGLPEELDEAWGGVEWTMAPVPFHGGHVVATPGVTWVSVHTLLPRIKEILEIDGPIDVPALRRPDDRRRFLDALELATAEFEAVFGQPLRFVHAVPSLGADDGELDALETVLHGGDSSDLDSFVTLLPGRRGAMSALVADFTLGKQVVSEASQAELDELRQAYDLGTPDGALRLSLAAAQATPGNEVFDAFLDAVATFLSSQGIDVQRLPILHVPERLMPEALRARGGFLINWNNVVLEIEQDEARAEGFESGLATIDEQVRQTFADLGYELRYAPLLPRSVMRGGGYRCASNHVR